MPRKRRRWAIGLNQHTQQIECLELDSRNPDQLRHLVNPTIVIGTKVPIAMVRDYLQVLHIVRK
jgi:hypothetical protein